MANLELNMYVQNSTSGYDKLLPTTTAEKIAYVNTTSGLTADDAQSAIDELSSEKVNISDIANNLTTTDAGKVLDARQGKLLNDSLTQSTGKGRIVFSTTPAYGAYFSSMMPIFVKYRGITLTKVFLPDGTNIVSDCVIDENKNTNFGFSIVSFDARASGTACLIEFTLT